MAPIVAALAAATLLASCSSARPQAVRGPGSRSAAASPPSWVTKPPKSCALGIAGLHAKAAEGKAAAEAAARVALIGMKPAKIRQELDLRQRSSGGVTTQDLRVSTKVSTSGTVGSVRYVAYWTDQLNIMGHGPGAVYVLACKGGG